MSAHAIETLRGAYYGARSLGGDWSATEDALEAVEALYQAALALTDNTSAEPGIYARLRFELGVAVRRVEGAA